MIRLSRKPLRDLLLETIPNNPGLNAKSLGKLLPAFDRYDLASCLNDLQAEELITMKLFKYWIVPAKEQVLPVEPQPEPSPAIRYVASGFIAPISKARLMGKR
jgi:hypothetical protein